MISSLVLKYLNESRFVMPRRYPATGSASTQVALTRPVVELFGAIAIWFQGSPLGTLGALAILGTSTGAIFFHLAYYTWKDGVPAMITWALSAFVAWQGREALLSMLS